MSWWVPIALAGGFWLGYVLRHSLGITRELGAWHEGYLWGSPPRIRGPQLAPDPGSYQAREGSAVELEPAETR
jgi:hypothetical protein